MKYLSFTIDNINPGKALFDFYDKTKDERYKVAMDTLLKQMSEQPRTSDGGFWHKKVYEHQMWLDGIFMASPYLAPPQFQKLRMCGCKFLMDTLMLYGR